MISTVIIDANKQDRDMITTLLAAHNEIKVLAQGNDGYDALRLIGSLKPDIVVLNNHLELIKEEDIPPLVRLRSPSTAVVILTGRINDYQLFRAAINKVSGFVHKETDLDSLPGILKCIAEGGCFISPVIAARILHLFSLMNKKSIDGYKAQAVRLSPKANDKKAPESPFGSSRRVGINKNGEESGRSFDTGIHSGVDPIEHLSKMELRILTCIGEGNTSSEIAENLDLATGTVRNYISSVMHKTGLHNRSQLVRYACYYGLVPR